MLRKEVAFCNKFTRNTSTTCFTQFLQHKLNTHALPNPVVTVLVWGGYLFTCHVTSVITCTYDGRQSKAGQDRVAAWPLAMDAASTHAHSNWRLFRVLDNVSGSNVRLPTEGTGGPDPGPWLLVVVDSHSACRAGCHSLFAGRGAAVVDIVSLAWRPVHWHLPVVAGALCNT